VPNCKAPNRFAFEIKRYNTLAQATVD